MPYADRSFAASVDLKVLFFRDAADLYASPDGPGHGFAPATAHSAGIDLRACFAQSEATLEPGGRFAVPAGVAIEIGAPGLAGFIYARSGLGAVRGLTVAQGVGVIDPDYRGEIVVWLLNTSREAQIVQRGERIAQLLILPFVRPRVIPSASLATTERGSGGFGHTGSL